MTVAIPCVPPPALFADCFSLAVFPAHVSDAQDGGHGLWFASGCSRCTALTSQPCYIQPLPPNACTSSSVVQFFAVAAPPASAPTVKRAVDQPPDPTLELRCDAHRCLPPPPQQQLVTARKSVFCWPCSPFASGRASLQPRGTWTPPSSPAPTPTAQLCCGRRRRLCPATASAPPLTWAGCRP